MNRYSVKPRVWLLFEVAFANSRGGRLFKINGANIEIFGDKTISKTTTQIFQPRNMLNCQIIVKNNPDLIFPVLKRRPCASFLDGSLFEVYGIFLYGQMLEFLQKKIRRVQR